MKVSMSPLNILWLYMERGLGFCIFSGLGGRVGGLAVMDKGDKNTTVCETIEANRVKNKQKDMVTKVPVLKYPHNGPNVTL